MKYHQYALNSKGQWVNATNAPFNKLATYYCECPEKHTLKHVKPSGRANKRAFTDYFAHVTNGGKRQRITESVCGPGGESLQHRMAKQRLREYVNVLSFATERCKVCGAEDVFHCQDCSIRLEMRSADGLWRYDCMLYDKEGVKRYALEVVHTHYTGKAKADSTRQTGLGIAEFAVADVMGLGPMPRRLENILVVSRECNNCQKRALEAARAYQIEEEEKILLGWDIVITNALAEQWNQQWAKRSMHLGAKAFKQSLILMKSEFDRIVRTIDSHQEKIWFETHRWGRIHLSGRLEPSAFGIVVNVKNTHIPANKLFIMVMDCSWEFNGAYGISTAIKTVWQRHQICSDLVFGVTYGNIDNKLRDIQGTKEVSLTNQLFAILKKNEQDHQICSQCGTYGHKSEACHRKFCTMCGRGGHMARECFARHSVTGECLIHYR